MLKASLVISLAESIVEAILAPAIRHTEEVTHIHVLQDVLQKIRHPRYYMHLDFAVGSNFGRSYSNVQAPIGTFTTALVIAVLRDNLARHDHEDLNSFYQVISCQTIDYAYRVGFVLGWLTVVIDQGKHPSTPEFLMWPDAQQEQ